MTIHLDPRHLTTLVATAGLLLGACGARPGGADVEWSFR
jgi:hypothetical protein